MMNNSTTPFGGGEDPSLLSSIWDYLTTTDTGTTPAESSSVPNEETHLLPNNSRTSTSTSTTLTTGNTMTNQDTVVDETPSSIKSSLQELDREIQLIESNKFAYDVAVRQSNTTATAPSSSSSSSYMESLKLAMLRTEQYQVKPAALRIMSFCNAQQQLFGIQSLGRHFKSTTTKDLTFYEQQILQSGCIQVLSSSTPSTTTTNSNRQRRRTSQTVLCYFPKYLPSPQPLPSCDDDDDDDDDDDTIIKSIMKVWWYIASYLVFLDDHHVQIQKSGVIGIIYQVGHDTLTLSELNFQRTLWWHFMCSLKQLPIRFVGYHYCFDNYKIRRAIYLYTNYYSKYYAEEVQQQQDQEQNSATCRFHDGTFLNIRMM